MSMGFLVVSLENDEDVIKSLMGENIKECWIVLAATSVIDDLFIFKF